MAKTPTYEELEQRVKELEKEAEEALRKRTRDMGERVKELNCLYGISDLVEKQGISLEEIFQGTINLIPPSWQYPEITYARIILEGKEFRAENFKDTMWKQASNIIVHGEQTGTLEVCYSEEKPESDEGPFLNEERSLINAIAERLGRIIERKRTEDALRKSEEKLRDILHGSPIPTFVLDDNHRVTYWNTALEEFSGVKSKDIVGTDQQWKAFYGEKRPCMADLIVDGKIDDILQWYPEKHRASDLIEGAYEAMDFFRRLGSDGKWLYFTAAPLKDSGGKLIGAVETLQDITETKKAEEQIRMLSRQVIEIQEREREALSREIHDNIGQLLFALKMDLSRANKKIPNELSAIKDQLTEISYLVNRVIKEIRGLSHALHPPMVEDLGLIPALEGLCHDFRAYSEIRIKSKFDEILKPLPSIMNITIYRLFQEGLSNILKHSKATEVCLRLTSSESTVHAIIEDNGVGFVVDDVLSPLHETKSLGLISMRERLALIGGVLQITSSLGKGTKIIASLKVV